MFAQDLPFSDAVSSFGRCRDATARSDLPHLCNGH